MRRTASLIMALGALTLSMPAWPGALYVPVVDAVNGNGTTLATQLWISNPGSAQGRANITFLPENTDGTLRASNPGTNLIVPGNGSFRLGNSGANGRVGMLEIDLADGSVVQAARLAANVTDFGDGSAAVPVVSSANMMHASQTADLVGLMHVNGRVRTDIGIMNLGQTAAQCTALLFRADGTQIGGAATVTLPPLSLRHFPAVFPSVLGQVNLIDARAKITCANDFYTYATVHGANGRMDYFIIPALSGSSTLRPPGGGGGPQPKTCSTGAVCFDFPGVVHVSTPADPDHSITLSPPSAAYSRLKVHLEVQVNGWTPPSQAAHGLLYLVRDKNKDMYANAFLRGPGGDQVVLRHGFGQTSGEKPKLAKGFTATLGETYAVDYLYDPVAKTLVLTVGHNGQEMARITGTPNVNRVHIEPGQKIIVGLSNPGKESSEPASVGWVYKNLHVELIP